MLEGHAERNLYYYLISLKAQRERQLKRLLIAKLKILEARNAEQEQGRSDQ